LFSFKSGELFKAEFILATLADEEVEDEDTQADTRTPPAFDDSQEVYLTPGSTTSRITETGKQPLHVSNYPQSTSTHNQQGKASDNSPPLNHEPESYEMNHEDPQHTSHYLISNSHISQNNQGHRDLEIGLFCKRYFKTFF
jgi:hypothetical protein